MFDEIAAFLINVIFTLFGSVLLLRAWIQSAHLISHPVLLHTVFQATDWLVRPLHRVLPKPTKIDGVSLLATWLTALVYLLLLTLIADGDPLGLLPSGLIVALLIVLKWALNLLIWATLIMSIMSWAMPQSPAFASLYQLTAPLLNPIRRLLPQTGGFDLSPLVLLVLAQVVLIIITRASLGLWSFV